MLKLKLKTVNWPLRTPFRIAGQVMLDVPVIQLQLQDDDSHCGHGEAAGIDYDGETAESMCAQLNAIANKLSNELGGDDVLKLLPRGGARNALDCALLDLRAKQSGLSVAEQIGVANAALPCIYTIGLGDAQELEQQIAIAEQYDTIKVKVDACDCIARVTQIRQIFPLKTLLIDANQAWTIEQLKALMPGLHALEVTLIEQPLPRNGDEALCHLERRIPIAADESCTDRHSLTSLVGKYDYINIKLDKCGGLTEALVMAKQAQAMGFKLMVGNMCGSSLAMAPAFYLGQLCELHDLDGPLLQSDDTAPVMRFSGGKIYAPESELWG